jgi:chemotaxis protein MotD
MAPQNFAPLSAVPPAQAAQTTAATLHSVSTLRDLPPTPDLRSMAVQIAHFSAGDIKHFEIRMDPAELGRVDVHLRMDDAGKAQASLVVEKPHALEALQKDSAGLERALKDAGIDLANNGLNFSLKGQERQQEGAPRGNSRVRNLQATAPIEAAAVSSNHSSSGTSGLDIRV